MGQFSISADSYTAEQFFTLFFDVSLDAAHPPDVNSFAVQINGTGVSVTGVTVDSTLKTVTLSFNASALTAGDAIEFSYSDPTGGNDVNAIQGTDGADAAAFSATRFVNSSRPGPSAPPIPTLSSGSDSGTLGDGITNVAAPTMSGTSLANATIKLYDTNGTTLLGTTTADGSGNWSVTSSQLSDGSHSLTVTQTDSGNITSPLSQALSVTIDTSASPPTTLALNAGSDSGTLGDGVTNVGTPTITGHSEAGAAVRLYDTDGTTLLGSATANGSGNWSITSSTLGSGTHTLTAKQTDVAGNVSVASSGYAYILDTVGPIGMALSTTTVSLSSASNGATVATFSATDATAVSYGFAVGNGTIDADNGKFTISGTQLVAAQTLTVGTYHIYAKATDAAGNDAFQIFTVNVIAAPAPSVPVDTGSTIIDGVPVTSTPVTLPGGSAGTTLTIPVVSTSAGGFIGAPNVADIPLVTANISSLLTAQVPIGTGLISTGGSSTPAGSSLTALTAAIKGQTAKHTTADQNHLLGNGSQFISLQATGVPLLINTVVVKNTDATSSIPLTLTGTSTTNQHTALIIDTSQLASNSNIVLNNVDFAAVVGAVTITGNTAGQIITGDLANQNVIVGTGTASQVYTGGGNDLMQYGPSTATATTVDAKVTTALVSNSTTAGSLTAATSVLLNGGTGNDIAVFGKAQSAYSIDQRDGYVLVTDKADTSQRITVTNTESLKFSDGVVNVESRAELTVLAGLYQSVLGRQVDIVGFDYWGASQATGVSLGAIAVSMLGSTEATARGLSLNGDTSHDIATLYQAVFGRAPEASGLAYWKNLMAQGQSIVDVANGFMAASEIAEHKLAATGWDLIF